jgi:hypothetical protein
MLEMLLITIVVWAVGNYIFSAFAERGQGWKRALKLAVLLAILAAAYAVAGPWAAYGLLALVVGAILAVHFWWLRRNGIHPITAEPRERYLELIGKRAGRPRSASGQ